MNSLVNKPDMGQESKNYNGRGKLVNLPTSRIAVRANFKQF
jgi:hypothetical protein